MNGNGMLTAGELRNEDYLRVLSAERLRATGLQAISPRAARSKKEAASLTAPGEVVFSKRKGTD